MYDHTIEVRSARRRAAELREEAARLRAEAERAAQRLEAEAKRSDVFAEHVHRMCTIGGNATCCGAEDFVVDPQVERRARLRAGRGY